VRRRRLGVRIGLLGQEVGEAGMAREVAAPVLEKQPRGVLVAPQVLGLEGDSHQGCDTRASRLFGFIVPRS